MLMKLESFWNRMMFAMGLRRLLTMRGFLAYKYYEGELIRQNESGIANG